MIASLSKCFESNEIIHWIIVAIPMSVEFLLKKDGFIPAGSDQVSVLLVEV